MYIDRPCPAHASKPCGTFTVWSESIPDGEAGRLSPADAGRAPGTAGMRALPDMGLLPPCRTGDTPCCCSCCCTSCCPCCCCWLGFSREVGRNAVLGLPEEVPGLPEDVPGLAPPTDVEAPAVEHTMGDFGCQQGCCVYRVHLACDTCRLWTCRAMSRKSR